MKETLQFRLPSLVEVFIITVCLSLLSLSASASEVVISDTVRDNFGIKTVAIKTTTVTQQWPATATVLDSSSLITLVAELRAAQAASAASASELKRSRVLQQDDNGVALKVVEAANSQAIADQGKVQSVRAQLQTTWGNAVSRLSDPALATLTQHLLNGAVLVRAEVAGTAPIALKPVNATLYLQSEPAVTGTVLGSLPLNAEQAVGRAYLLSVDAKQLDLQAGQVLRAELQDAARKLAGVQIPRAALVRWQGQHWVYVQHDMGHYERIDVQVQQWTNDGAFITQGLTVGDQLVTVGAGLLLGAEHAPPEEEESGKAVDKD